MNAIRITLRESNRLFEWTIGVEGQAPIMTSRTYFTREEMRNALIAVLKCLQADDFEVADYCPAALVTVLRSTVANIIKTPGKKESWQILSRDGWVVQVLGQIAPGIAKGDVMVAHEPKLIVGRFAFTVARRTESPVGSDVFAAVGPGCEIKQEKGSKWKK